MVECHPNVLVLLASVDCHLASFVFKNTFVLLLQLLYQLFVDLRVDMADIAVIKIPAYGLLVVTNSAVGKT